MGVLDFFISFWKKLKSIGIGNDPKKNANIALMNQIAFMGSMVCFAMVFLGVFIQINPTYPFLAYTNKSYLSLPCFHSWSSCNQHTHLKLFL